MELGEAMTGAAKSSGGDRKTSIAATLLVQLDLFPSFSCFFCPCFLVVDGFANAIAPSSESKKALTRSKVPQEQAARNFRSTARR